MAGSLPKSGVQLAAEGAAQFVGDMNRSSGALTSFQDVGGRAMAAVGSAAKAAASVIAAAMVAGAAAVGGFVASGVGVAADFEQTLNVLGATSGATEAELAAVGARAKELGSDMRLPTASAGDAAEVMLELSKAGMTVAESMDAAEGALLLAAAAGTDNATAAAIMSATLNTFNLEASESVRIADLLAGGANASSASMTDLGQGVQQAGFAFAAAGLPAEDLVTSLAALTNVGLTGSDAGTALKNALMQLMNPTDKAAKLMRDLGFNAYDAQGQMKQWPQLLNELNVALAGMSDEERNAALGTIFLSDGMKAVIPLLDLKAEGYQDLKEAVTEAGAAEAVAAAQMKGWNGAMKSLQSQVETLQLVIGQQFLPMLTPLGFAIAGVVGNITTMADSFATMIPSIMASENPLRTFLHALAIAVPGTGAWIYPLEAVTSALSTLGGFLLGAATPMRELAPAIRTVAEAFGVTPNAVGAAMKAFDDLRMAGVSIISTLAGVAPTATGMQTALSTLAAFVMTTVLPALAQAATWFATNLPAGITVAQTAFANLSTTVQTVMPQIVTGVTTALTLLQGFWTQHGATVLAVVSGALQAVQGAFTIALGVIQGVLGVALLAMGGDYETAMGQIQSSNETIWNGIAQFFTGILEIIAAGFGTSLDGIVRLWQSNFEKLPAVADALMGAAQRTIVSAIGAIVGAFRNVIDAINDGKSAVQAFIAAAARIRVPPLITPGSPTPLETGLRGIADAAKTAGSAIASSLTPALASAGIIESALAASGGGMGSPRQAATPSAGVTVAGSVGVALSMSSGLSQVIDARVRQQLSVRAQATAARGGF